MPWSPERSEGDGLSEHQETGWAVAAGGPGCFLQGLYGEHCHRAGGLRGLPEFPCFQPDQPAAMTPSDPVLPALIRPLVLWLSHLSHGQNNL